MEVIRTSGIKGSKSSRSRVVELVKLVFGEHLSASGGWKRG